jgi:hypothetical protein
MNKSKTSSYKKTLVHLSKIQKTDEKGKGMASSLKLGTHSAKIEHFTLPKAKKHSGQTSQ